MNPEPEQPAIEAPDATSAASEEPSPEHRAEGPNPNPTWFKPGNTLALKHGLYSKGVRDGQAIEARKPLLERRDVILVGGTAARNELRQMLANSVVMLDHAEAGIALALAAGVTTSKGRLRAAVSMAARLAEQKSRLIERLLPLLEADTASRAPLLDLSALTDQELAAITEILDNAKARTEAPADTDEPTTAPPVQHIRIEVPE